MPRKTSSRVDRLSLQPDLLAEGEVGRGEAGQGERHRELRADDDEERDPAPTAHVSAIRPSSRLRWRSSTYAIPSTSSPAPIIPSERGSADQKTSK